VHEEITHASSTSTGDDPFRPTEDAACPARDPEAPRREMMSILSPRAREPDAVETLPDLRACLEREAAMHRSASDGVALLRKVLARADALSPDARSDWLCTLRRYADRPASPAPEERDALIALATRWADWPLVLRLASITDLREGASEIASAVITAMHRLGNGEDALACCRSRMLRHPHERMHPEVHAGLAAWRGFVDAQGGAIDGGCLRLEPLGHHHLADFAWQYHDPEIARLCCLPAFQSEAQWHAWLDASWGYGDQRLYAVIDPEWGFVGSVSLIQHGALGFFYYWIGPDFQGQGRGAAAVRILLGDAASRRGMRSCYAKVFVDNQPSRRAMEKLGFAPAQAMPAPPWSGEMFYRHGEQIPHVVQARELQWLFERMGSQMRIRQPLAGVDPDVVATSHQVRGG